MPSRKDLLKVLGIVIFFILLFMQYLYQYPIRTKPAPDAAFERSVFYFKLGRFVRSEDSANSNYVTEEDKVSNVSSRKSNSSTAVTGASSPKTPPAPPTTPTKASLSSKSDAKNSHALPTCPERSPLLRGMLNVTLSNIPSLADIGRIHKDLQLGGYYKPPNCTSKDKVAIVVPFRDREEHLRIFLYNLIPILKRQQIEFNIFVIEQGSVSNDEPFNRAMLFNVGFVEANKRGQFDCFIFHDVDLIPENDYNLYNCPVQPRHMSVAVDKMGYKLPYKNIFGGISALTTQHFKRVNGFSNSYWGWGAEDDDMATRIAVCGLYISRPPPNIARYKMLKHQHQKMNNQRFRVLQKSKTRVKSDGLNSLKYSVEQIILDSTYTLIRVHLPRTS